MKLVKGFLKKVFCFHSWKETETNLMSLGRCDNEVCVWYECPKCKKTKYEIFKLGGKCI